jgi:hypothetical protein
MKNKTDFSEVFGYAVIALAAIYFATQVSIAAIDVMGAGKYLLFAIAAMFAIGSGIAIGALIESINHKNK